MGKSAESENVFCFYRKWHWNLPIELQTYEFFSKLKNSLKSPKASLWETTIVTVIKTIIIFSYN